MRRRQLLLLLAAALCACCAAPDGAAAAEEEGEADHTAAAAGPPEAAAWRPRLRVLLFTSSMPSHVYLATKLARALAGAGHAVDLAAPAGRPAVTAARDVAASPGDITVVPIGVESKAKPASVRAVSDPTTYAALLRGLCDPMGLFLRQLRDFHRTMDVFFAPLLERMMAPGTRPDVIVATHSTMTVATDAAERAGIPALVLQGFPYDPAHANGLGNGTWAIPRSLSALPHTSTYPTDAPAGVAGLAQRFWLLLDACLIKWGVYRSGLLAVVNTLRSKRGLEPIAADEKYPNVFDKVGMPPVGVPVIALGGPPFIPTGLLVPPRYRLVGALDDAVTADSTGAELGAELQDWLSRAEAAGGSKVLLASFGTGTELSVAEGEALAAGLGELAEAHGVRSIVSMRASEQVKHFAALEHALGAPSWVSEAGDDGAFSAEFLGGAVRVQARVPQRPLLLSGNVDLFLSHCGFGSIAESLSAGVPLLAYPAGLDQPFNAARIAEAGAARMAPKGLRGLAAAAAEALRDEALREGAARAAETLRQLEGARRAVEAVELEAAKCSHRPKFGAG